MPNPEDPGGNDGGQVTAAQVPVGDGLQALTTFHGGNSFTIGGFPAVGADGGIRSGGFLSGVPGFGAADPAAAGGAGSVSSVGGAATGNLSSQLVNDPFPNSLTNAAQRLFGSADAFPGGAS